jgi:hypothetical protein
MRIDGMGGDALMPTGNRAQTVSPGDVVQGRVTASDNGQVEMRLTDGSTLHARVAEGVRLDAGTVVRLQIGERQDGIPTAQVLERLPAGTAARTDAQSPAQLVGDALRALGEKAVPQLVERALALVRETGMPENQAAFLAANAVEGSDPAASLLGRMLEGQYELGANLRSLAAGMADALAGLPQAERDALLTQQGQTAQLGGLADRLMQAAADKLAAGQPQPGAASDSILSRNGVALSGALREALATLTQSGQTPQSALTVLQNALLPVPGGRVLLSLLLPGMGEAAGVPAGMAAAVTAATTAATPASGDAAINMAAQTGEAGTANPNAAGMAVGAAAGNTAGATAQAAGTAVGSGVTAGAVPADNAVLTQQMPDGVIPGAAGADMAGASGAAVPGAQAGATVTAGTPAGAFPLNPETAAGLSALLAQVSEALTQGTREQMTPEQARAAVLTAFDQAVAKAGTEQAGISPREVDVGKLAQAVREQLEWSAQALSRLDTDTAAALRPMLQDAATAMRLFNQISTYQAFVQVPLQINGQDARGELYVMKRKGSRGRIDASDFTLFLALDTEHLGHVETLAHARQRQVTLQFRVPGKDVRDLLAELKPTLYEGLEKKGFHLVDLKVRTSQEEPISVLTALRAAEEHLGRTGGVDVRL